MGLEQLLLREEVFCLHTSCYSIFLLLDYSAISAFACAEYARTDRRTAEFRGRGPP